MHTTLQWGNFQLDGIGFATYTAIILYQLLRGWDGINKMCNNKKKGIVTSSVSSTVITSASDVV